jgi:DNA-binding MarR family transcriptional regulator
MSRSGADLAMLFLGSYRKLVDDALAELASRGHPDARAAHLFAMSAIVAGADSAPELASRLSVSRQAAAKTIAVLLEHGYISRDADPRDPRRMRIEVTPPGAEVMLQAGAIFDELRDRWEAQLGAQELAVLEAQLTAFVGASPVNPETPGWIAQSAE